MVYCSLVQASGRGIITSKQTSQRTGLCWDQGVVLSPASKQACAGIRAWYYHQQTNQPANRLVLGSGRGIITSQQTSQRTGLCWDQGVVLSPANKPASEQACAGIRAWYYHQQTNQPANRLVLGSGRGIITSQRTSQRTGLCWDQVIVLSPASKQACAGIRAWYYHQQTGLCWDQVVVLSPASKQACAGIRAWYYHQQTGLCWDQGVVLSPASKQACAGIRAWYYHQQTGWSWDVR